MPATIIFKSQVLSVSLSGLAINCPFSSPTIAAPIGPLNGMSDNDKAADAAIMLKKSCFIIKRKPKKLLEYLLFSKAAYKAGGYVQESLLESLELLTTP